MDKIKTLLIDDEISAINTLKGMLDQFCPEVRVLGHASTVGQAVELIGRTNPELLLLDIEMPPFGNAFDLIKQIKSPRFGVIFTTAYPKYALEAIKVFQPWAYLVKPYSVAELSEAIQVALRKIHELKILTTDQEDARMALILPDARKGNFVVRFHEILYCQSEKSTVDICIHRDGRDEKVTTYKSLKDLEGELPEQLFCRTHNSYIVNMSHIQRIERTGRNGVIHLPGNKQVQISVLKMDEFEEKFEAFLLR